MATLTLILGTMKSGKSYELIRRLAPLPYAGVPYAVYQPSRNVRDQDVRSRNGGSMRSAFVDSLEDIPPLPGGVIGIDEVHMFPEESVGAIPRLLEGGTSLVLSGLDLDYRGLLLPVTKLLLEVPPDEVVKLNAVCEYCRSMQGANTVVLEDGRRIRDGLPPSLPDDGRFEYRVACRACFATTS